MADTLDDIVVNNTWQSLYSLSSIVAGASLFVQNKSATYVVVATGAQPSIASVKGFIVPSFEAIIVDGSPTNAWVRTVNEGKTGVIFVEAA